MVRTSRALSSWLAPAWELADTAPLGPAVDLRPDVDQIEALTSEREALWARIEQVSFLTLNEKRAAVGYAPLEEAEAPAVATDGDMPVVVEKYDPNQPRVPAGVSEGGQWVDAGGGGGHGASVASGVNTPARENGSRDESVRVAQAGTSEQDEYWVDLRTHEERYGGHTLRTHVNKSDEELLEIVRRDRYDGLTFSIARIQQGSFLSEGDASYFVNETIKAHWAVVGEVASGASGHATLSKRFGSVTGKEAFRVDVNSDPVMRPTYAVRIIIEHDPRAPEGFRVRTAFPRNQLPGE